MTQFLKDQVSDKKEVVLPLMLDGTYLSRNFATLGPLTRAAAIKDDEITGLEMKREGSMHLVPAVGNSDHKSRSTQANFTNDGIIKPRFEEEFSRSGNPVKRRLFGFS